MATLPAMPVGTAAQTPTTSRRTLLGAGLGALMATVAAALGRPQPASGANGDAVIAGGSTLATLTTSIYQSDAGSSTSAFEAFSAAGYGVVGLSKSSNGVEGTSTSSNGVRGVSDAGIGVQGRSNTSNGVYGYSNSGSGVYAYCGGGNGVWGYTASKTGHAGIVGQAANADSYGGFATNLATGTAVYLAGSSEAILGVAPSSPDGVAVGAHAGAGATALKVEGKAKFNRSGRAIVGPARSFVDVKVPGGLDGSSLVIATPMVNQVGVHVQAAVPNPATGTVRIYLNKVASSSFSTPIAWFVIN